MNKNVCIIHYNTPTLTECLVESINKHVQGANIFIFDNSDKKPFTKQYDNVKVFNNTKGQIINFEKWLKNYPRRILSGGKTNKWGSAKHAYSVEKCMELIKEPFVLLDSDVLIKKDFSCLYDEKMCYVGEVVNQPKSKIKRVLPFICLLNPKLCFSKKIHYFDEQYMHGLRVGNMGDCYDTGAALYLLTEKAKGPHRALKVSDYIVHYENGSWLSDANKIRNKKHIAEREWLNKYKSYWYSSGEAPVEPPKNSFTDAFDHIYCLHYLPDGERLTKLKNEFMRVGIDWTADYFTWVYDYPSPLLDLVFSNKNLKMDVALRASSREYIKRVSLKHYEIIRDAYLSGYERVLIMENDIRFHKDLDYIKAMLKEIPDSDVVLFDKMVCSAFKEDLKYKEYIKTLPENAKYGGMDGIFYIFASCYSLNRKGMKHIIDKQEKVLAPPDTPFNDKDITGSFAVINLAIQDPKLKTRKSETYDRIGLDTSKYGCDEPKPDAPKKKPVPVVAEKKSPIKPRTLEQVQKAVNAKKKRNLMGIDKAKHSHTRTLFAESAHHNRLYDV